MLVLGLNYSNDSAAAIVRDGEVLGASQEERFTRVKHDRAFPGHAINFCLKRAGAPFEGVDAVGFFWNPGIHASTFSYKQSGLPRHHMEYLYNVPNHLLRYYGEDAVSSVQQVFQLRSGRRLQIHYITHHMTHAASALFRSPFEECALLTVDGYGERSSVHIAHGAGLDIKTLRTIDFPHSIGSFYAAFTEYLGFRPNSGEGKLMGLAAYGKPRHADAMRELLRLTEDGFEIDLRAFSYYVEREHRYGDAIVRRFGPPRRPESEIEERHMDLAASVQLVTEEALLHLARMARRLTGLPRLAMAGGVVLNCSANGRISREAGFDECFFQPCAGDGGCALGAALYVTHCEARLPRTTLPTVDSLGPEYTDDQIAAELVRAHAPRLRLQDPARVAAEMLAEGLILGWFQGRAEYGPRALGNRSILADPRPAHMKDTLNGRVKFREPFRPFAPSVLAERAGEIFTTPSPTPFMLRADYTREEWRARVPAVTHVDGSARVQTVSADTHPLYHRLISHFGQLTGVPCVLNTSFNIRGEPVVNTVAEALRCFYTTGMDALFVGSYALARTERAAAVLSRFSAA
jgi:carbamoyltransferase